MTKGKARFDATERIGVNVVERIFLSQGWLPRTLTQSDVGVDMEVEMCDSGKPIGQLIAVQIKSGNSFFVPNRAGNITYYIDDVHLDYWLRHCLPVLLVLYNPDTEQTVWQTITEASVTRTKGKGWKTEIPVTQNLDASSFDDIKLLNKYPPYIQKLQRLAIHLEIMAAIEDDERIVVELSDWCNKSIGRASIEILNVSDLSAEYVILEGHYIFFNGVEAVKQMFPWADFTIDVDYYEAEEPETDLNYYEFGSQEWIDYRYRVRPIETGMGEIHLYRFELSLNEIGKAFIQLSKFLEAEI